MRADLSRRRIIRVARWVSFSGISAINVLLMLVISLVLSDLPIGFDAAATQTQENRLDAASVGTETEVVFPLVIEPGKRYLEDLAGKPFLIHGDTAWGLITQLTREDVERYLDDRRARGFNTIIVKLIEHRFATNPPANAYGQLPFQGQPFEGLADLINLIPFRTVHGYALDGTRFATQFADFSKPNEAYFVHADWVLRRAAAKGFLVLLAPSWTGYAGGSDGWYRAMVANGPDRLRQYGEYLGRRYRDFSNILWVQAGDFNPPRKDLVTAIAEGIREFDPRALHTAHQVVETATIDYWGDEPWLQLNAVYTYKPVYAAALAQYARPEGMPFFLIESMYENEHETTERRLRTQAYQAVLCGAAGQIFGNNPIWHFDGPGLFPASVTWQQALGSRGAQSMTHLYNLLSTLPWWQLEPDTDNTLLTRGFGSEAERAVAARAADRSFAILYLPSSRIVTVDLGQLAGPEIAARWYDPADGRFSDADGSPFPAMGARQFTPQVGNNSSGFDDWVLILESRKSTTRAPS